MRRHEWNRDRSALEDAQPRGERSGTVLETQCDSVALLDAHLQEVIGDPRGMRGQFPVARLLPARADGLSPGLCPGDRLESIADGLHRHGAGGLRMADTRSRTSGDTCN